MNKLEFGKKLGIFEPILLQENSFLELSQGCDFFNTYCIQRVFNHSIFDLKILLICYLQFVILGTACIIIATSVSGIVEHMFSFTNLIKIGHLQAFCRALLISLVGTFLQLQKLGNQEGRGLGLLEFCVTKNEQNFPPPIII